MKDEGHHEDPHAYPAPGHHKRLTHPDDPHLRYCRTCGRWLSLNEFRILRIGKKGRPTYHAACYECNPKIRSNATIHATRRVYPRIALRHRPSAASLAEYQQTIDRLTAQLRDTQWRYTMDLIDANRNPVVVATPYRIVQQNTMPGFFGHPGTSTSAVWYVVNTETKQWHGPWETPEAGRANLIRLATAHGMRKTLREQQSTEKDWRP